MRFLSAFDVGAPWVAVYLGSGCAELTSRSPGCRLACTDSRPGDWSVVCAEQPRSRNLECRPKENCPRTSVPRRVGSKVHGKWRAGGGREPRAKGSPAVALPLGDGSGGSVSPSPESAAVGYLGALSGRSPPWNLHQWTLWGSWGLPIAKAVGSRSVTAETLSGRGCMGSSRWALQPAALSLWLTLTSTLPFVPSQTPHLCQFHPVTFSLCLFSIFYPPLCYCRFLIGLLSPPRAISVCSYLCSCCFIWEDKYTLLSCWCHCIKDLFYRIYRVL